MINVSCYCFGRSGFQIHGQNFVEHLNRHESVALFPVDSIPPKRELNASYVKMLDHARSIDVEENLGIGLGSANIAHHIRGSVKVGHVAWETTRIPEDQIAEFRLLDRVWTPSEWGKQVLLDNGIGEDRIGIVPEGVDPKFHRPLSQTLSTQDQVVTQSDRPFRILFVGKWEARKGIELLLSAYAEAFRGSDSVELVLQSYSTKGTRPLSKTVEQLRKEINLPIVLGAILSNVEMVQLYNLCDVLVMSSRAEAWALPVIEAMSCAKPVIVSNYGGHLEYVNSDNAYLIDIEKMVEVHDSQYYSCDGSYGEWAEPDIDHLVHLLRYVYEHQDEARLKGLMARQQVKSKWTWEHANSKALAEIEYTRRKFGIDA